LIVRIPICRRQCETIAQCGITAVLELDQCKTTRPRKTSINACRTSEGGVAIDTDVGALGVCNVARNLRVELQQQRRREDVNMTDCEVLLALIGRAGEIICV